MKSKEHISKEELEKYLNSELSSKEMHETELKIEEDNFNDSAFEGYASNPGAIDDLLSIRNKFNSRNSISRSSNKNLRMFYSAAAVIVVVFMSYLFINFLTKDNESSISDNLKPLQVEEKDSNQSDDKLNHTGIVDNKSKGISDDEILSNEERIVNKPLVDLKKEVNHSKKRSVSQNKIRTESLSDNLVISEEVGELVGSEMEYNMDASSPQMDHTNSMTSSYSWTTPVDVNGSSAAPISVSNYEDVSIPVIAERSSQPNVTVTYIYGLKVIDYTAIYEAEIQKEHSVEMGGVDAMYENKDKVNRSFDVEKIIEYTTYADFLEDCITEYKSGRYIEAIDDFKIILREHPEELNAWFYCGLSYFELGDYVKALKNFNYIINHPVNEFNQEAEWHKVLTLIRLNSFNEAEILLNKIIRDSLFYYEKAVNKLEDLNQ